MAASIAFICLFTPGCASIVDGGAKNVRIDSNPSGTKFTIYNKTGKAVESKTTPANVSLRRHEGFFKGQDYRVVFEAPGYSAADVRIKSKVNDWFYANIFFGGLIGMTIDGASGAMWVLSPTDIKYDLISAPVIPGVEATKASLLTPDPPIAVKSAEIRTNNEERR
jgi:hypothetical protein